MTFDILMKEAERLARKSYIYSKAGKGDDVCAYWFDNDQLPVRFAAKYNDDLYFIIPYNLNYVNFDY